MRIDCAHNKMTKCNKKNETTSSHSVCKILIIERVFIENIVEWFIVEHKYGVSQFDWKVRLMHVIVSSPVKSEQSVST